MIPRYARDKLRNVRCENRVSVGELDVRLSSNARPLHGPSEPVLHEALELRLRVPQVENVKSVGSPPRHVKLRAIRNVRLPLHVVPNLLVLFLRHLGPMHEHDGCHRCLLPAAKYGWTRPSDWIMWDGFSTRPRPRSGRLRRRTGLRTRPTLRKAAGVDLFELRRHLSFDSECLLQLRGVDDGLPAEVVVGDDVRLLLARHGADALDPRRELLL